MNLDEMKEEWQEGTGRPRALPETEARRLLAEVTDRAREFERRIRRRDLRELVILAVVCLAFLPLLARPSWVTRAGVVVVLGASVLIYLNLRRAHRRHAPPGGDLPLAVTLRRERSRIESQVRLLESVLWWYVLPLCTGVVLVFAGSAGWSVATLLYALATGALGWGVARLNRWAVRSELDPRRRELDELLERIGQ